MLLWILVRFVKLDEYKLELNMLIWILVRFVKLDENKLEVVTLLWSLWIEIKFDEKEFEHERLDPINVLIVAVVIFAVVELMFGKVALLEFSTVVFSDCPCCAKMRFATVKLLESAKKENWAFGPMSVLLKVILMVL